MNWSDIKPWVSKLAPMLGAAIGGPLGGAAGSLIGDALGIKDASADSIQQAIKSGTLDADHILALKTAEQAFSLQMAQMQINSVKDLEALAVDDRKSAREREIRTGDSWTPRILAAFVVISWITINGFLVKHSMIVPGAGTNLDANMEPMLMRVLGTLDAAISFVLAYYFGSSAGSDRKTEIMGSQK